MQPSTQTEPRIRKRVPCTLRSATGREHAGMVLNLSRGGLFVQTGAHVAPGDDVTLELNVAQRNAGIPVGARVVWRRAVAPQLRAISPGGFGVRIESASKAYVHFIEGMTEPAEQSPAAKPEREAAARGTGYRVRLKQTTGPRTRWVCVRSSSEKDAHRVALLEAGAGWAVLECRADGPDAP